MSLKEIRLTRKFSYQHIHITSINGERFGKLTLVFLSSHKYTERWRHNVTDEIEHHFSSILKIR